jgi:hypothetical protein
VSVARRGQARQSDAPAGRWETIRSALDSNARTARLCLIILATGTPPAVIIFLIHR